jgi:TetR/AcrR family transcriptional regulator, transcriptional repressor for nem operon
MVAAAGRGFRKRGFGGIGVDGLAREADVTSGAFYGHFTSKENAFDAVVAAGIGQLAASMRALRAVHGAGWVEAYVDRYLGEKRTCDLAESCALQSLGSEVARSGSRIRSTFQRHIVEVAETAADGFEGGSRADRIDRAWAFLAILSGGVTLARAVEESALSESIANGVRKAAVMVSRSE